MNKIVVVVVVVVVVAVFPRILELETSERPGYKPPASLLRHWKTENVAYD